MTPLPTTDPGPERAARALITLSNSRPRSPRLDEIVAVIESTVVARRVSTLDTRLSKALDAEYGPDISATCN
jgi:hypothetical protein